MAQRVFGPTGLLGLECETLVGAPALLWTVVVLVVVVDRGMFDEPAQDVVRCLGPGNAELSVGVLLSCVVDNLTTNDDASSNIT